MRMAATERADAPGLERLARPEQALNGGCALELNVFTRRRRGLAVHCSCGYICLV